MFFNQALAIGEVSLLILLDKKVPVVVDEFNWHFCSIIREKVVSAT
jgi:hypothetical protein